MSLSDKSLGSRNKILNNVRLLAKINKKHLSIIKNSKLFDPNYYVWKNGISLDGHMGAHEHYVLQGWKHHLDTHPLFRDEHYRLQADSFAGPALIHYLLVGYRKNFSPHPLFDVRYYYEHRPDVKEKDVEPLTHYLDYGSFENMNPSEFFDERYYKSAYPFVPASGMNALVHYVLHGDHERLNPSRVFTTREYVRANPDVEASAIGALEHYALHGRKEGRPLRPDGNVRANDGRTASLSVVIPTYNRASLIRETLELCQKHSGSTDIEFVVIDDGSSDETASVLEEMAERYDNIVYRSIENGGPGRARNLGASLARKDVILFIGDDIQPMNSEFFETHARLHGSYPSERFAVLGKCVWPDNKRLDVNHVMRHIQGRGGEQFGYADFTPYTFIDWRFFYTANVSVKKSIVQDWERDGFNLKFTLYGYEDIELAYRLAQDPGGFTIFYDPTSVGRHIHPYTVEGFLKRQFNAGLMAEVFLQLHDVGELIGVKPLLERMRAPPHPNDAAVVADCLAVLDGIKAWTRLLDRMGGLGREAWHDDLLFAVFEAAYYQGFITSQTRFDANLASAYQFVLSNFVSRMRRTIHHELSASEFVHSGLFEPMLSH